MNGPEPNESSDETEVTAHLGICTNTDHPPNDATDEDYTDDTHEHPKDLEIDDSEDVTEEPGGDHMEEETCSACTKPSLETVNQTTDNR